MLTDVASFLYGTNNPWARHVPLSLSHTLFLALTDTHAQSTCSHCVIEHLGSISHFKNVGNNTTIVGTETSCYVRLVDRNCSAVGTINCWCSSASWWRTEAVAEDKGWQPEMEAAWFVTSAAATNCTGTHMGMREIGSGGTWDGHLQRPHGWRPSNLRFKQRKTESTLVWAKQTTGGSAHLNPGIWG